MAQLVVRVEYLTHDLGLWCRDCLLSSGARLWYATSTGPALSLRAALRCTECGGDNVQDTL